MKSGVVFCDGGARGNPGPAAAAAVLYDEQGRKLAALNKYLGIATNNVAEYYGVLLGLTLAKQHHLETVCLRLDSELVVRQLEGKYRVRQAHLLPLWQKTQKALAGFAAWEIAHIPREENGPADYLVKQAIDRHETKPQGTQRDLCVIKSIKIDENY